MALHHVIIFYDEDRREFEYQDWDEKYHGGEAWAQNDSVWLTDAEYEIITSWKKAQALMREKCPGYKPKEAP